MSKAVRLALCVAAIGFWSAPAWAEAGESAALAAAMKDASATLQVGLKASEREGTPISAKFEIEDGKPRRHLEDPKSGDTDLLAGHEGIENGVCHGLHGLARHCLVELSCLSDFLDQFGLVHLGPQL